MASATLLEQASLEGWSDEQVVSRVLAGETELYEVLMRRYNRLLYRVARSILRDDDEAEDVMQDSYVRAYQHLSSFEGRSKFSTWLTRIAVHEALGRARKRSRIQLVDTFDDQNGEDMITATSSDRTPEQQAYDREVGSVLEKAVLALSEEYRLVFMLRDVEGMNTEETAESLNLTPENVKVRLHRARAALRRELFSTVGATAAHCFDFHAVRCDRVVGRVRQLLNLAM
jgi:RNA polymerase sigma-70 factor (ECF subfamily)